MKFCLLLLAALALCAVEARTRWHQLEATNYDFDRYVHEFGKHYDVNEHQFRKSLFDTKLQAILDHNRNPNMSWKMGVNHMSDWTESEFRRLLGHKKHLAHTEHVRAKAALMTAEFPSHLHNITLPPNVDWRLKGAVTPVKDQGNCGSCWTFASTESIESAWFLRTGQLFELSEQQVASCTPNPLDCGGTGGCEGGSAEVAFQGVIDAGGIASEWTYSYASWNGSDYSCRINTSGFAFAPYANLSAYVKLPVNDQNALLAAVATIGPIPISVDASSWSAYEEGVFSGCNMTAPDIDHAVLLVGYGTDPATNLDYFLVRNSWTPTWGESGYVRILRTANPVCGVDPTPGDGTACKPYPSSQTVCGMCGILSDSAYPIVGV